MEIFPDDREILGNRMKEIADKGRTGGAGYYYRRNWIFQRDVTPEATEDIIERRVPGIPEANEGLQHDDHKKSHVKPGGQQESEKKL